jgi:hypothetical protein
MDIWCVHVDVAYSIGLAEAIRDCSTDWGSKKIAQNMIHRLEAASSRLRIVMEHIEAEEKQA